MRSVIARGASETNNSGGNQGRSRWQSAEMRRYCMAPSIAALPQCRAESSEPRSAILTWLRLEPSRWGRLAQGACDYRPRMPDEISSGGDYSPGAGLEARVTAVEARLGR